MQVCNNHAILDATAASSKGYPAPAFVRGGGSRRLPDRLGRGADVLRHFKEQDQIEKRFWVLKGPLQIHPLWLHKDERLVGLVPVLMIALLIYCLLEYLAGQAQHQLTGRALLEAFAAYTVVLLRFNDGS
jgi:hypothetical protein